MPTGWMIGSFVIKGSMFITLLSFLLAFLIIYLYKPLEQEKLKKTLDLNGNALFLFLLGLWIGKIILNLPLFFRDPMAVLAYPSNSVAFYFGCLFFVVYLIISVKKKGLYFIDTIYIALYLYSTASILYYFLPILFGGELSNFFSFLFFILLFSIILIMERYLSNRLAISLALIIFAIGNIFLTIYSNHILFGYSLSVWFYSLFLVLGLYILSLSKSDR